MSLDRRLGGPEADLDATQKSISVQKKNQLDVTEWFIALIICSTCYEYFYAHHEELHTICVLLLHTIGGNTTHIVSSF